MRVEIAFCRAADLVMQTWLCRLVYTGRERLQSNQRQVGMEPRASHSQWKRHDACLKPSA